MSKSITFVIGANGVGKSAIVPHLRAALPDGDFEVIDFDQRGVPDGADRVWRASETRHWLETAKRNAANGRSTVVCGFMKPAEIAEAATEIGATPSGILLDVDEANLSARLPSRYPTPESLEVLLRKSGKTLEKFLGDNVYVAKILRRDAEAAGYLIVDTNGLSPKQVAEKILERIA